MNPHISTLSKVNFTNLFNIIRVIFVCVHRFWCAAPDDTLPLPPPLDAMHAVRPSFSRRSDLADAGPDPPTAPATAEVPLTPPAAARCLAGVPATAEGVTGATVVVG